jgi:hypothetical protein
VGKEKSAVVEEEHIPESKNSKAGHIRELHLMGTMDNTSTKQLALGFS